MVKNKLTNLPVTLTLPPTTYSTTADPRTSILAPVLPLPHQKCNIDSIATPPMPRSMHNASTISPPSSSSPPKRSRMTREASPTDIPPALGKLKQIIANDVASLRRLGWNKFLEQKRQYSDFSDLTTLNHKARRLLRHYKYSGVPAKMKGGNWSREKLDAAIHRGAHQSCQQHLDFLKEEFLDMVAKGQWIILPYHVLVELFPHLRISPPGVVPQRDCRPRWICDYTWSGVNDDTLPLAPAHSMQFGNAIHHVLRHILLANPAFGPVSILKLDIADGFYRLNVAPHDIPRLGVVFPNKFSPHPLVALPLVLPMGWVSSPPAFCAATETAADIANAELSAETTAPPHPLEELASSIPVHGSTEALSRPYTQLTNADGANDNSPNLSPPPYPDPSIQHLRNALAYVDVYMDDFLALAQHPSQTNVRRVLLHSIDKIFKPLEPSDPPCRREPVSVKKLKAGDGTWATIKTVLGWVLDTIKMTLSLPEHRVARLEEILHSVPPTQKRISIKKWHKILGELRSMSLALPGARHCFSHMQDALRHQSKGRIALHKGVHQALDDFRWMTKNISRWPTRLAELVPLLPSVLGDHDACQQGAGGILFPADSTNMRHPHTQHHTILWRASWPQDVQRALVTPDNPQGTLTMNDLELAGGLLHLDAAAQNFDLRKRTILSRTDNSSALFWQRRGSTSTTTCTAHLLRLFGVHQRHHRYVPRHDFLPGRLNTFADQASRLFHLTDSQLLTHFSSAHPQTHSYKLWRPSRQIYSAVISAVKAGVSSGRSRSSCGHWRQWRIFTDQLAVDPFLEALDDKVPFLQVFARRLRTGELSPSRNTLRSRSVEDYVRSIGQAFLQLGMNDPRLGPDLKQDHRLVRMWRCYSKANPPPDRVKPVPIQVLQYITTVALASNDALIMATADMITLAFFFLLRPGEYTDSPSDTKPFHLQDVQISVGSQRLNLQTATDAQLQAATFVSLTFTEQKNGVRGEVIGLGRSGNPNLCPVNSLVRRVLHLRQHNAAPNTPLARVHTGTRWSKVTPTVITRTLRAAVTYLSPASLGFLPTDVSARCLRAAGANALLCAKVDTDIIRLLGRWRSDEMLRYLHLQAAPVMRNFARDMLAGGSFTLLPNQLVPQQP